VDYLVLGVNSRICSAGHPKSEIILGWAEDGDQGFQQLAMDGSKFWLLSPASEVCAIVGKIQPITNQAVNQLVNGLIHESLFLNNYLAWSASGASPASA
jgi:hypothetical protein